jgi:hypothetical protein
MASTIWTISLNKATTKYINSPTIINITKQINDECDYKEYIMADFHKNEKKIKKLENNDNIFDINNLLILSDLHLYREDYFKVLADMEKNIRKMIWCLKKLTLTRFPSKKAKTIISYLTSTF